MTFNDNMYLNFYYFQDVLWHGGKKESVMKNTIKRLPVTLAIPFLKEVCCLHHTSTCVLILLTALAVSQVRFLLYPWFSFGFVRDQTQTSALPNCQRDLESRNRGCLFTKSCLNINLLKISDLSKNAVKL